jgi:DNA polymerase-3 subunit gamma/tau
MTFIPAARKYRPQRFSEILDQPVTVRILQSAIRQNRIPNAFMFHGPRGTGKTTLARVVAKALNCDDLSRQIKEGIAYCSVCGKPQFDSPSGMSCPESHGGADSVVKHTIEPCDVCFSCVNIREGNDTEVLEIDAASHGGKDDAKELQQISQQEPKKDKWRIIILDECHMLTTQAQNALLALFENPPRAFLPILCTTEVDKVLPTIASRCMRFTVQPIGQSGIKENLKRIFSDAGQTIEDTALTALVRTSQGNLRDIQQVADQAIAAAGGELITDEFLERVTGLPTLVMYKRVAATLMTAWEEGPAEWFAMTEELWTIGGDFHQLFFTVIGNLIRDFRIAVCSRGLPEAIVPYWSGIPHATFEAHCTLTHDDLEIMTRVWDLTAKDFSRANTVSTRFNVEFWFLRCWDARRRTQ